MNFGKHSWVCSLCGQGLTRKSTAIRHNDNLHFGGAQLVRPYEYIIGRLNGKFVESDPSIYRRNKKDLKSRSTSINDSLYYVKNRSGFGAIPDSIVHESSSYGNVAQQQPINYSGIRRPTYPQPAHHSINPSNGLGRMLGTMTKLEQLDILLKKYFPPDKAAGILRLAAFDNEFLDRNLTWFQDFDRGFY